MAHYLQRCHHSFQGPGESGYVKLNSRLMIDLVEFNHIHFAPHLQWRTIFNFWAITTYRGLERVVM